MLSHYNFHIRISSNPLNIYEIIYTYPDYPEIGNF